ncbi:MAG TPA: NYN domain-containing protein [Acidimicrobiales bacterium]|nr:NYN domain-containing protein [Acidimicrobiales bacterium]
MRRALSRAVEIARRGELGAPPVPAPAGLRPVLRFRRLPPAALETARAVLDADAAFRARVAAEVGEHEVGRVAWLWLARPDGWAAELSRLLTELADEPDASPDVSEEDERQIRRQLRGAERAASRAAALAARAEADLERSRKEVLDLRAERDELAAQADELRRTAEELTQQRTTAVSELKRAERLLAQRTEERRDLRARLDARDAAAPSATGATAGSTIDAARWRAHLDRLGRAIESVTTELQLLREVVGPAPSPAGAASQLEGAGPSEARRGRRRALAIPAGFTSDSVDAAAHLLARPGAVLLVDGYNVSMAAWPESEIAEQRGRLERVLADLASRIAGLLVDVVFDGADVTGSWLAAGRPSGLTVRFTPAGVEADDVVLELVERYPLERPVVVASSDRRVRDGARRRGANVISSAQLLAVARL